MFPAAKFYNLLEADTFQELSSNLSLIRQQLSSKDKIIIIDEVQKLPSLLDEVHLLIQRNKDLRFILTGSSARKLKRSGSNLLAGRGRIRNLHPLVFPEIGKERLMDRLRIGSLPFIIDSSSPLEDLKTYCGTYLQEEVKAEAIVRNIENFSKFLLTAGLTNGSQVNFENVGRDSGLSPRTVREYYQIIVDTLLGYMLEPYSKTRKRKSVAISKFYLFDLGIANFLMKRGEIQEGSSNFGDALEHLIFLELRAYLDYKQKDLDLCYWRSTSKYEVDFTVGDLLAIEVKAKEKVSEQDFRGIRALREEGIFKHYIIVTNEKNQRITDEGIKLIPVNEFLELLWSGEFV